MTVLYIILSALSWILFTFAVLNSTALNSTEIKKAHSQLGFVRCSRAVHSDSRGYAAIEIGGWTVSCTDKNGCPGALPGKMFLRPRPLKRLEMLLLKKSSSALCSILIYLQSGSEIWIFIKIDTLKLKTLSKFDIKILEKTESNKLQN